MNNDFQLIKDDIVPNIDSDTLGSVQVLYKQVFPNSGPSPPPLNKQNKHDLRPPP